MADIFWYPGHELLVPDIARAENCDLHDAQGRRLVDLESGVWCTSIGHAHPRIVETITRQCARLMHTGFVYSSAIVAEAADEILAITGLDGGRCAFLCSGSEAVEYTVRVARQISCARPLFLTMTDSYFGAYGSASRKDADAWFCFDWSVCRDCDDARGGASRARGDGDDGPHTGEVPGERDGCDGRGAFDDCDRCDGCEHWSTIPVDRIGGFLFEPGSSSGFVRFPPVRLIRSIVGLLQERGDPVLVNEVTTGVGRTGRWFGHQHYGITPDFVAIGKGIGNGYPVAVAVVSAGVVERLRDQPIAYAQSHQNDPLGAAVAREVVRVIQDGDLIERGRQIGDTLVAGIERIRERCGGIAAVRGRGPMIAVDLDDAPPFTRAVAIHRELVRRGFVLALRPASATLRIDPSLTIEHADIDRFLETLEAVLGEAGARAATGSGGEIGR